MTMSVQQFGADKRDRPHVRGNHSRKRGHVFVKSSSDLGLSGRKNEKAKGNVIASLSTEHINGVETLERRISHLPSRADRICQGRYSDNVISSLS